MSVDALLIAVGPSLFPCWRHPQLAAPGPGNHPDHRLLLANIQGHYYLLICDPGVASGKGVKVQAPSPARSSPGLCEGGISPNDRHYPTLATTQLIALLRHRSRSRGWRRLAQDHRRDIKYDDLVEYHRSTPAGQHVVLGQTITTVGSLHSCPIADRRISPRLRIRLVLRS